MSDSTVTSVNELNELSEFLSNYVDGYELRECEDENGNCGDYQPNDEMVECVATEHLDCPE